MQARRDDFGALLVDRAGAEARHQALIAAAISEEGWKSRGAEI